MVHAVKQEEEHVLAEEKRPVVDDIRVRGEESDGWWSEDPQDHSEADVQHEGHHHRRHGAFIGPLHLLGADVLRDEGRRSHGHTLDEEHDEGVELVVARPAGHAGRTEVVNVGLDENVRERGDDRLDTRRETDRQDLPEHLQFDAAVVKGQTIDVLRTKQQEQCEPCRDELRDDRRERHAEDAEVELQHEQEVEDNVYDGGQYQEVQWAARVTDRTQDAGADVVDEEAGDTREVGAEVGAGVGHDVVRSRHEIEHERYAEDADDGEEHTAYEGGGHGGLDGIVQPFHVFRTEIAADDDTGTDREAVEEEHRHVDDHRGRADRREGLGADVVADDDRVDGVVQHLEDVAEHQWQREKHDLLRDVARRHVTGGGFLFDSGTLLHKSLQFIYINIQAMLPTVQGVLCDHCVLSPACVRDIYVPT